MSDDAKLRSHFASLRREEESSTPPAANMLAGARAATASPGIHPRRLRRSLALPLAAVVAVVAVVVVTAVTLRRTRHQAPFDATPAVLAWQPPTDFLLCTPAQLVLTEVPAFGTGAVQLAPPTSKNATPPTLKGGKS